MEALKAQFLWDLQASPLFTLDEPNGEQIDIPASFAGVGKDDAGTLKTKLVPVYRAVVFLGLISVLIMDLFARPLTVWVYFGYLTNMALIVTVAYSLLSLICTVFSSKFCFQPKGSSSPSRLVLITWVFYSLAAPLQLQQTLLYWSQIFIYHWHIDYLSIMKHGLLALLLFVDGAVIGKIPIRLKHFALFFAVFFFYTVWSVVHSLSGNGDGYFDWSENSRQSTMFAFIAVLIFAPLVCILSWFLSTCGNGRRLLGSSIALPYARNYASNDHEYGVYHGQG